MSVTVEARGVEKTYRDASRRVRVLSGVDLVVEPGEIVSIVGPSGSGKTTLLHLLGGLETPDAGSVIVDGTNLRGMGSQELARFRNRTIGFVFQFHQLLPDFTAVENVMLPGRIAGRGADSNRRHAVELLEEVGLRDRIEHFPNELSGGERQRVAVCRALALEPPLLLADEPTGNLDPTTGHRVFGLLVALAERHGTTMIMVTHNREIASRCARMLLLDEGMLRCRSRLEEGDGAS